MTKLRTAIEAVLVLFLILLLATLFLPIPRPDPIITVHAQAEDHLDRYVVTVGCPFAPQPIMARSRIWALIQTTSATVWTEQEWKDAYMLCLRASDEPQNCGHHFPQFKPGDYKAGK